MKKLCYVCGFNPPVAGSNLCQACRDKTDSMPRLERGGGGGSDRSQGGGSGRGSGGGAKGSGGEAPPPGRGSKTGGGY